MEFENFSSKNLEGQKAKKEKNNSELKDPGRRKFLIESVKFSAGVAAASLGASLGASLAKKNLAILRTMI